MGLQHHFHALRVGSTQVRVTPRGFCAELRVKTTLHARRITRVDKGKNTQNILTGSKVRKKLRDINKEIDSAEVERKNIESFQSKSISAFSTAVTPRLLKAFGDKYSLKTSKGKLILQKDIATLRAACENKIPDQTGNDRQLFTTLLEQLIAKMNDFSSSSFNGRSYKATSASSLHKTEIDLNVSPIKPVFH